MQGAIIEFPFQTFNFAQLIPATTTTLVTQTVRLIEAIISNPQGNGTSPITVSVSDNQGSPIYVIPPTDLPPGASVVLDVSLTGRLMLSGIKVTASATGCNLVLSYAGVTTYPAH